MFSNQSRIFVQEANCESLGFARDDTRSFLLAEAAQDNNIRQGTPPLAKSQELKANSHQFPVATHQPKATIQKHGARLRYPDFA